VNLRKGLVGHWTMEKGSKFIETEKGHINIDSEGEVVVEGLGFRPDYVEFVTHQQIENVPTEIVTPENEGCPENVNGWSKGAVTFNANGVVKQMSLTAVRNSDSTNHRRVAASSDHVSNQMYVDDDGYICGRMRAEVIDVRDDGFVLDIDEKYVYDETIFFNAYNLGFGAEAEIGFFEVQGTGKYTGDVGFEPDYLEFIAGQEIQQMDYEARGGNRYNGLSFGMVDTGELGDQYSLSYGAHAGSTSNNRRASSSDYPVNVLYDVEQDLEGRLRGYVDELREDGFEFEVSDYHVDEVVMYRAFKIPLSEVEVGYKTFTGTGEYDVDAGFRPADVKVFTQNRIHQMDFEEAESGSTSCGGGGNIGYSTGFIQPEAEEGRQVSVSTGRNSGSMNAHIHASSDTYGLNAIYTHREGEFCGHLTAEVTNFDSTGFSFDVSDYYTDEVTLYRAFSDTSLFNDNSAYDNHGMTRGNPEVVNGFVGDQAMEFDGETDFVSAPITQSDWGESGDTITFSVWFKANEFDGRLLDGRGEGSANGLLIEPRSDSLAFWPDSGDSAHVYDASFSTNTWYHLIVEWEDSTNTVTVYVDGKEVGDATSDDSVNFDSSRNMNIGRRGNDTDYMSVIVEELRVYNRALSEKEIKALYNIRNKRVRQG